MNSGGDLKYCIIYNNNNNNILTSTATSKQAAVVRLESNQTSVLCVMHELTSNTVQRVGNLL